MDYHSMKRKELQALCKKHNIPANLSNLEMANKLASLVQDNKQRVTRGKSSLKGLAEIPIENDSDVVNGKIKKFRFSPENEMMDFVKSDANLNETKREGRRKSMLRPVAKKGDHVIDNVDSVDSFKEIVDKPLVRATRSTTKEATECGAVLVRRTPLKKKRGRRELKEVDGSDKPPPVVESTAIEENQVLTRRSLRNRVAVNEVEQESKGVDVVASRKSVRQRNLKITRAHGSGDVSENKALEEDGGIAEPEKGLRRSKRNMTKDEGSELLDGDLIPRGRNTRSRTQVAVKASAVDSETGRETNVEVQKGPSRRPARNGNRNKSVMFQTDNEEEIQGKLEVVLPLEEPLKRAARNHDRQKAVMPQVENGNMNKSVVPQLDNEEDIQGKLEVVLMLEEPLKLAARNNGRRKSVVPQVERVGIDWVLAVNENRKPVRSLALVGGFGVEVPKEHAMVPQLNDHLRRSRSNTLMVYPTTSTKEELDTHGLVEENESLRQLRDPFALIKAPRIIEKVMRSRQSGSRDEPVAIPDEVANAAGVIIPRKRGRDPIQEEVAVDNGCPVEELLRRSTDKTITSESIAPGVIAGQDVEKSTAKSRSKPPNLEVEAPLLEGPLAIKELSLVDAEFSMPEVAKTTVNSDFSRDNGVTDTDAERRKLRRISPAEKQESTVKLQTDHIEQEMGISVRESVVFAEVVNNSMEVFTEKSLVDCIPKAIENDLAAQFLGSTEIIGCNNSLEAEPLSDLNVSGDTGSGENISVADDPSLLDQSDSMTKLKGTENEEEPSVGKHIHPSSLVVDHYDERIFVNKEQHLVHSEEMNGVSKLTIHATAVDDRLYGSNQSGALKKNKENAVEETPEASFIGPSDGDPVSYIVQEDKDGEDPKRFMEASELQESTTTLGKQSMQVESPLTKSIMAIDEPPTGGELSVPEVGESVRKTVSNRGNFPDHNEQKRMSSMRKSYLEDESSPESVCPALSKEVGDLVAANLEKTLASNSVKLNRESGNPVTEVDSENTNGDSDSINLFDPETVKRQSNISDEVIAEIISRTDGFSSIRQLDYFEGLNKTTDLSRKHTHKRNGVGNYAAADDKHFLDSAKYSRGQPKDFEIASDEGRKTCMLYPCDGERNARKIAHNFEESVEAVDLQETISVAGKCRKDGSTSSSPCSVWITPCKPDTISNQQGVRIGSQNKIEEGLTTNENDPEEAVFMGRASPAADEESRNDGFGGNVCMPDISHNVVENLDGQLAMVTEGDSERKCSSVFEDVIGRTMHESFIGEGNRSVISEERDIRRAERIQLPVAAPESTAFFNDDSSWYEQIFLEDSDESERGYVLKNLFATPANSKNANEEETISPDKTNIKVGDGRSSRREAQDVMGAKESEHGSNLLKRNTMLTTDENITNEHSNQEDQLLEIHLAMPDNSANSYEGLSCHDETLNVVVSVDNVLSKMGDVRSTEREAEKMAGAKKTEHDTPIQREQALPITRAKGTGGGFSESLQEDELKILFSTPVTGTNPCKRKKTFGHGIKMADAPLSIDKTVGMVGARFSLGTSQEFLPEKNGECENPINQENMMPMTSEETSEGSSTESWQEDQLKLLFATPAKNRNSYQEMQSFGIEREVTEKVMPVEKTRDGGNSQGDSEDGIGIKKNELEDTVNIRNMLRFNGEETNDEDSNESKDIAQENASTSAALAEVIHQNYESSEQMTAGLLGSEKVVVDYQYVSTKMKDHQCESTKMNNSPNLSVEALLEEDRSCHETIGKAKKQKLNFASLEADKISDTPEFRFSALASVKFDGDRGNSPTDLSTFFHEAEEVKMGKDMEATKGSDGLRDTRNRSDIEDNTRTQQVVTEKRFDDEDTEELILVGEIVCQGSNKHLCEDETLSTAEETNEVHGSSQNINDTVHCAHESKDSAERHNFGDAFVLKPALDVSNVASSEHGATELNGEPHKLSMWEIEMLPGDNKGEKDKLNTGASETDFTSDHNEAAEDLKENRTSLAEEQLGMHEFNLEEQVAKPNDNQIDTVGAPIFEHDEILKEQDVDIAIKEYLDSEYNENVSLDIDNSTVTMQNEVLTKVVKRSHSEHTSLVEPEADGDIMCTEIINIANVGVVGDKPSVIEGKYEENKESKELREPTSKSNSRMADQAPMIRDSVTDRGFAAEDAWTSQRKDDPVRSRTSDANVEEGNILPAKQLTCITQKRKNARISFALETPSKLLMTADMKENAPSIKKDHIGSLAMVKSATKRRALEEL
ncbi:unnamed protein product [Ilex paraguariensis]|uniref:Uncharacterized protein n=1 Tax=Ilex paraguariensis TaxID=185542 RepID=A0ABC8QPQ1_9AQUA